MPLKLQIKIASGSTIAIEVEPTQTVKEVKEVVAVASGVPAIQQRLIYSGKVLKDPETIASYNVQEGHTVHMVKGPPPAGAPAAPTAEAPAAAPAAPPAPAFGMGGPAGMKDEPAVGGHVVGFSTMVSEARPR